jgi:hypothetical protein
LGLPKKKRAPNVTGDHSNAKAYRRWRYMNDRLFDLTDMFADITVLINKPDQVIDPEKEHGEVEEDEDEISI